MAFATLPYPSMDFTPLDVLTADELDQIVANINAVNNGTVGTSQISDGSITTAKLANSAVSSANIDWSSFPAVITDSTTLTNVGITTSFVSKITLDITNIPTGADFAILVVGYFRSSTAGAEMDMRITYNSSNSHEYWAKQPSAESPTSIHGLMKYTKASGANSATVNLKAPSAYTVSDGYLDAVAII